MPTAKNAKISIETGQKVHNYAVMNDSGDQTIFTISSGDVWSGKDGYTPSVRPDGIASGRELLSTAGTNDQVNIAAFTAYIGGSLVSVSATNATFSRPATASRACIYTVSVSSSGTITITKGTISGDTSFSETRDAAGGPPYIPTSEVELGQIRITTSTAATLSDDEILQVPGQHAEYTLFPSWSENNIGDGIKADSTAEENAHITFAQALPQSHTGGATKKIYIKYYEPIMTVLDKAMDFVPPQVSHSLSSTQYYRGSQAAVTESVNQGSFTTFVEDGVSDSIAAGDGEKLTVKMWPDENKNPYILCQGYIGIAPSYPAGDNMSFACTISAEAKAAKFTS